MTAKVVKSSDAKGRISLGQEFANKHFLVTKKDGGIILTPAQVIPETEMWLHQNEAAFREVMVGLEEAKQRKFAEMPDFESDASEATE